MCAFENTEQEQVQMLRKEIFIQSKPSLKYEQNPNPNAAIRVVRKIFQSHSQLIKSIYNIIVYLNNYRQTLGHNNALRQLYTKYVIPPTVSQAELSKKISAKREEIVNQIWNKVIEQKEDLPEEEWMQIERKSKVIQKF